MKRIRITHKTEYHYRTSVTFGPHQALLRPREGHDVHIESSLLTIEPKAEVRWLRDIYGNSITILTFSESSRKLSLFSEVNVDHHDDNPLDCVVAPYARSYPFQYAPTEQVELIPYRLPSYPYDGPGLQSWLADLAAPGKVIDTFELLVRLNTRIYESFKYSRREEAGVQLPCDNRAGNRILPRLCGAHDGGRPAFGFWGAICHRLYYDGRRPARGHSCLDGDLHPRSGLARFRPD